MLSKAKRFIGNTQLHREEGSKSRIRQLWEILLLAIRHRFSPVEYEAYGFFHKKKDRACMRTYLSNYEVSIKVRRPLYDKTFLIILNNKLIFNRFFSSFGLPLPKLYGFLDPQSGFRPDGTPLRTRQEFSAWLSETDEKQMFVRPVGGLKGSSILAIKDINDGQLICEGGPGREWTAGGLYDYLLADTSPQYFPGFLFEELVKQHPQLTKLNSSSVNTCRILTIKRKDAGIEMPMAYFRIGRKGSVVDNFSQGGVAAGVNMETGLLKRGTLNPRKGLTWASSHPDSGTAIEGFQIPYWEETKKLAAMAAAVIPGIRTVGWDVAITAGGPLLIEGNSSWNPITMQQANEGLLTPTIREIFGQYGLNLR